VIDAQTVSWFVFIETPIRSSSAKSMLQVKHASISVSEFDKRMFGIMEIECNLMGGDEE
jgi:hypothetical protein